MDIKQKKKEMELKKIDAAIAELEYKVLERMEDIQRIEDHIKLQKERKEEILKDQ